MKQFLFICIAFLAASCFSEDGVELGTPSTFIKFFNDGYDNEAVGMEEVPSDGGFIIVMNSSIRDSEAETTRDKICLIKTDEYGTEQWRRYFPDIAQDTIRYKAHSLTLLANGEYLVMGESIKTKSGKSYLLALKVPNDQTGNAVEKVFQPVNAQDQTKRFFYSTRGQALVETKASDPLAGNFLFVASSENPQGKMVVGELNKNTLDTVWTLSRGDDYSSIIANKAFYDVAGDGNIYWGGTVIKALGEKSDIRITKNPINGIPGGDPNLGTPSFSEVAEDLCLVGSVFCFVGSIDRSTAQNNTNILFKRGTAVDSDTISYIDEFIPENLKASFAKKNDKNESANSITPTSDGGFMILATIDTYTGYIGRGDRDLLLMKINGFGGYQWSVPYGTIGSDEGKVVRQTNDGGYISLGTSRLAGTRTLILVKTDKNGQVN